MPLFLAISRMVHHGSKSAFSLIFTRNHIVSLHGSTCAVRLNFSGIFSPKNDRKGKTMAAKWAK